MIRSLNDVSAEEAVKNICSGERVFIHGAAATPQLLVTAMTARGEELHDVELASIHTEGDAPYLDTRFDGVFHLNTFFVGANSPAAVGTGMASYVPIFLSEIPNRFRSGVTPPTPSASELKIGDFVAGLVEDGATLQAGIGAVPDAAR